MQSGKSRLTVRTTAKVCMSVLIVPVHLVLDAVMQHWFII